jgi:hypothetical protein
LVLLAIAHAIWRQIAWRRLDRLIAGYRESGEPTAPEDFDGPPIPDADNGAVDLRAAGAALKMHTSAWEHWCWTSRVLPLTPGEREAAESVERENAAALAALDAGFSKPQAQWRNPWSSNKVPYLPQLPPQRELTNLLSAAAHAAHSRGDDAAALRRIRQVWWLARSSDDCAPLEVSHLVASGQRLSACEILIQLAPDLHAESSRETRREIRAMLDYLLSEDELRRRFSRALYGERFIASAAARALARGSFELPPVHDASLIERLGAYGAGPLALTDTFLVVRGTSAVAHAIDQPTNPAAISMLGPALPIRRRLWVVWMPDYERFIRLHYQVLTTARLAATALAIRLYAADHDARLPPSLADLVPAYLPAKPIDGFDAAAKPLRFLRAEPDPRLYSVGFDGTDDGGSDTAREPDADIWRRADAVVHLRRQPRDMHAYPEPWQDTEDQWWPGTIPPGSDPRLFHLDGRPASTPRAGAEHLSEQNK